MKHKQSETQIVKAGQLLCIDQGDYSDYQILGFFVVIKEFDAILYINEYLKKNPEQSKGYRFNYYQCLSFLLSEGLLIEIEYKTLYMGDYGSCDDVGLKIRKDYEES